MENCVLKDTREIIKKEYQALLLAEERISDMVYGSEKKDTWLHQ